MRQKVLITGGAGFIGSNLVARFLDQGYDVIIFDNLSRKGSEENLNWILKKPNAKAIKFVKKDIRDFAALQQEISKCEIIFHLASQVAVTSSVLNPREDFEINVIGTFNLLEAAREAGHRPAIIFASTNKVYGNLDRLNTTEKPTRYIFSDYPLGIDEEHLLDFHSPYGCSKGVGDQYVRDYSRIYNIPTIVFRQSCIYGPRQIGMEDQGWVTHLAAAAILKKPITIYGNGKQVRDVLYIDNLLEAYQLGLNAISRTSGQIFNIGGGSTNALSLLEYVKILEDILGYKVKIKFDRIRPGDQKVFISDNSKIKKHLKWEPKISYKVGIKNLLSWIEEHRNLFQEFFETK